MKKPGADAGLFAGLARPYTLTGGTDSVSGRTFRRNLCVLKVLLLLEAV